MIRLIALPFALLLGCVELPSKLETKETIPTEVDSSPPSAPISPVTLTPKPPLLSATLSENSYLLTIELAPDALMPEGGFDTYIGGEDQNDGNGQVGMTRVISGLDTNQEQCFQVEARYTQTSPRLFLLSNRACVAAESSPGTSENNVFLDERKAFPSAQGHGADEITGGRGGKIFYVTDLGNNLNGSYDPETETFSGSLKYALSSPEPGYIIFRVSGVIKAQSASDYYFSGRHMGNKTVMGATAPFPGVVFYGHQFKIGMSDKNTLEQVRGNWIVRGMTFLGGRDLEPGRYDSFSGQDVTHVLMSDNSVGWSSDEAMSFDDADRVIMQRNLFFEGHPDHNTGSLLSSDTQEYETRKLSSHNNAYVHISHRFPNVRALDSDYVDIINQFVYNWRSRISSHKFQINLNDINNYYKPGPRTSLSTAQVHWNADKEGSELWKPEARIFTQGHFLGEGMGPLPWTQHISANGFKKGDSLPKNFFVEKRHPLGKDITVLEAKEAYERNIVGKNVGARYYMDSTGQRRKYYLPFIEQYLDDAIEGEDRAFLNDNRKFVLPDLPESAQAYIDKDFDGMPDEWEEKHGLKVGERDHNSVKERWSIDGATYINNAGYTNMEIFNDYAHGGLSLLIN